MDVLIVSDSHGDVTRLYQILQAFAPKADSIIFAGDGLADIKQLFHIGINMPKHYCLRGNTDQFTKEPEERVFSLLGRRVLLVHGHRFESFQTLVTKAESLEAEICVFGHSHLPFQKKIGDCLFINPGSIARPRGVFDASFALLSIEEDRALPPFCRFLKALPPHPEFSLG
jgi:uncharacterized protein